MIYCAAQCLEISNRDDDGALVCVLIPVDDNCSPERKNRRRNRDERINGNSQASPTDDLDSDHNGRRATSRLHCGEYAGYTPDRQLVVLCVAHASSPIHRSATE